MTDQQQDAPDHPDTAQVFVTNAVATSAGTGHGARTLPWDEAKALVDQSLACYGSSPPLGLYGHG